jgi:hypothetical protein
MGVGPNWLCNGTIRVCVFVEEDKAQFRSGSDLRFVYPVAVSAGARHRLCACKNVWLAYTKGLLLRAQMVAIIVSLA